MEKFDNGELGRRVDHLKQILNQRKIKATSLIFSLNFYTYSWFKLIVMGQPFPPFRELVFESPEEQENAFAIYKIANILKTLPEAQEFIEPMVETYSPRQLLDVLNAKFSTEVSSISREIDEAIKK